MKSFSMILICLFLSGTAMDLHARRERVIENPVDMVAGFESHVNPPAELFYRAEIMDPEQLRGSDGFWSAGMSANPGNSDRSLFNHVSPGAHSGRSAYISATRTLRDAHIFGNSNIPHDYYIYLIAGGSNIFDVQGSLGPYTPPDARGDVAALFRITWGQVYGWYPVSFGIQGALEHNPMFDRGRYGNATSSPGFPELAGFPQGDPRWGNLFFSNVAGCDNPLRSSVRCYLKQGMSDTAQKIFDLSAKKSRIPILPLFKTPISQVASSKGTFVSLSNYLAGLCYVTAKNKIECRSVLNNGKLGSIKETAIGDTGYDDSYMFGDVNNDQKDDFCRLTAVSNGNPLLKCNLGDGNGSFPTEVNFGSVDGGWASGGAVNKRMIVKGITGRSYFCRIITVDWYEISCRQLVQNRSGSSVTFTLGESGTTNDRNYYSTLAEEFGIFTDSNQDGVPDWCNIKNQQYDKFDLNCWWSLKSRQFSERVPIKDLSGDTNNEVMTSARIMNPRINDFCSVPKNQLNSSVMCYSFTSAKQYKSTPEFNYATRLTEAKGLMSKDGNSLCATEVRSEGKTMRLSCVSKNSKSKTGFSSVFSTPDFDDYGNVLDEKRVKIVYSNGRSLFCAIGKDAAACLPLNQNGPACQRVASVQTSSARALRSGFTGLEDFQGKNECLGLNSKDRCYREDGMCYKWDY
ncbi:heat-labile enterotoxin alpha chain [Leptospira weilii serovar Ranarum str. ICFT]|uniref:Heat-labile enterotoxin alpha chain n=1 Tax=Leptospira weilii serovar Ranarum str. ICFT TaxID=1218598 RepID=N1WR34_9LEPT|nr:enterotoxin A family protein [Leptospira weilii]EMY79717.1 heat-labile enterotoxin alpha chain [Leptospira weilii serovar Ranarum str. ICFT]